MLLRYSLKKHALQWRHNGRNSVSNHQPHDCLLNGLFRRRSKKTPKLRVTGLCVVNSPGNGEFPAQMASNTENVSIRWRHHHVRDMSFVVCRCNVLEVDLIHILQGYFTCTKEIILPEQMHSTVWSYHHMVAGEGDVSGVFCYWEYIGWQLLWALCGRQNMICVLLYDCLVVWNTVYHLLSYT